jgi:hypothetical protein
MGGRSSDYRKKSTSPGPGMYNPKLDHGTSAFMAGKPKDKITSNDFVPGPGQYTYREHSSTGGAFSRSSKFEERKSTIQVGPG